MKTTYYETHTLKTAYDHAEDGKHQWYIKTGLIDHLIPCSRAVCREAEIKDKALNQLSNDPAITDTVSISWHVDDVECREERKGVNLSDSERKMVLDRLVANHDACIGINWDTIDCEIDFVLNLRDDKNTARS